MTSADLLVHDEVSRSDQKTLEDYNKYNIETKNVQKELDRLLLQQQYLLKSMVLKQARSQYEAYMAQIKAKYEQNLRDEETLLMLL